MLFSSCLYCPFSSFSSSFFFLSTSPPVFSTLSLHDALPISAAHPECARCAWPAQADRQGAPGQNPKAPPASRSEEHTSELQSRGHLVCRLLLEKKKKQELVRFLTALSVVMMTIILGTLQPLM